MFPKSSKQKQAWQLPSPSQVSRWERPLSSSSRSGRETSAPGDNSQSEPWLMERVHKHQSASLCHPSACPELLLSSETHPPHLIPGFSASASAEVIFNQLARERALVLRSSFLALSISVDHASTKAAGLRKRNLWLWLSANKGLFRGAYAESRDY